MAQKIVSNKDELASALTLAKSGDTIFLEDGDYGSLLLKNKFAANVTIAAMNPQEATFSKIDIRGAHNVTFSGIEVESEFRAWLNSKNIVVDGVKTAQFYFRDVDGLTIDHSEAADGWYNLTMNCVTDFAIRNSYFHGASEDVVRLVGNSYDGLFENNIFSDTKAKYPIHPDLMQMFHLNGYTPHDITIRGNLFYDDPKTGSVNAQGIFLGDPGTGFKNILIENNLIAARHPNSIYVNGGIEGVVIRDNTLLADSAGNGAIIRLANKSGLSNEGTVVENNVLKMLLDETKDSTIGDNHIYGYVDPSKSLYASSKGDNWEDYMPKSRSAVDFDSEYGAVSRLEDILESGSFWSSAYAPPTPAINPDSGFDPVYIREGLLTFNGAYNRILTLPKDPDLQMEEGTVAFTFDADMVGWRRTIMSRDAAGNGNHFSVMIKDGTLDVKFGDSHQEKTISISGVKANQDYDFVASFDETGANAWLDGKLIGHVDLHMDWSQNNEALLLGADNSISTKGTVNAMRYPYDGTLENFLIEDVAMTPAEVQAEMASIGLV